MRLIKFRIPCGVEPLQVTSVCPGQDNDLGRHLVLLALLPEHSLDARAKRIPEIPQVKADVFSDCVHGFII